MTPAPRRRKGRSILALRHPAQYVVLAFVATSGFGALLLSIPAASVGPGAAAPLTALFTATSAVCVTGLVVVGTGDYWTTLGQWIILGLIQVGGLGIMTLTSLIVFVVVRRLGLRQRMIAAAETGSINHGDMRRLLVGVASFSFGVEAVASLALFLRFWISYDEGAGRAAFLGVFHAVSAFNNAGFSLFNDNMVGFRNDPFMLVVLAATVVIGGLGYLFWTQVAQNPRTPHRWSLHAKLTIVTTVFLIGAAWLLLAWFEWTNPRTLGSMSAFDSLVNAMFHSVMPRTAGFNSLDIAGMREPSRLLHRDADVHRWGERLHGRRDQGDDLRRSLAGSCGPSCVATPMSSCSSGVSQVMRNGRRSLSRSRSWAWPWWRRWRCWPPLDSRVPTFSSKRSRPSGRLVCPLASRHSFRARPSSSSSH